MIRRPDLIASNVVRPQLNPLEHLAKYSAEAKHTDGNREIILSPQAIGRSADDDDADDAWKKKRSACDPATHSVAKKTAGDVES